MNIKKIIILLFYFNYILLGGIFPENDLTEKAFNLAIRKVNRDRHDSEDLSNIYFVNETIHDEDVFEISQNGKSM